LSLRQRDSIPLSSIMFVYIFIKFRIVVEFKEHILNVPLPADLSQKIKNYQQFLEA